MNTFNKVEIIGIFLSIAVMAVALSVVRFKADTVALGEALTGDTQGAVVAVTQEESVAGVDSGATDEDGLREALTDASSADGTLVRLVVDDVRIGSGASVEEGDTVTVHYEGTTQSGVRFDSSYERNEPFVFTIGAGKVIAGWEKGLIGMKVGGQRILVIPADMAYGNRQVGPIAPDSTLVFSIELLTIE